MDAQGGKAVIKYIQNWGFFKLHLLILCVYMHLYQYAYDPRTICKSWLFPSTVWSLDRELRSSALAGSTATHQAISLVLSISCKHLVYVSVSMCVCTCARACVHEKDKEFL